MKDAENVPIRERGIALVTVLVVLTLLLALGALLANETATTLRLTGAFHRTTAGFYAAESGLNRGIAEFRDIFTRYGVPAGDDFDPREITVGPFDVTYQLEEAGQNPQTVTIPAGQPFAGLNSIQYTYVARSTASVGGDVAADVGLQFDLGLIPLFQFLAFYQNRLAITPAVNMTLHGRIHTNDNLYLNISSGQTLTIEDAPSLGINFVHVSASGSIYRGRSDSSTCSGTVRVDKLPGYAPQTMSCIGGVTNPVPSGTLNTWGGTIFDGIERLNVPPPEFTDRGGEYWNLADLRIVLRVGVPGSLPGGPTLAHTIEVQDINGNVDNARTNSLRTFMSNTLGASSSRPNVRPVFYTDVPVFGGVCTCRDNMSIPSGSSSSGACNNTDRRCYSPNFSTDSRVYADSMTGDLEYRRGGFYNWRERKWMLLLNLNVHDLLRWNMNQGGPLFEPSDRSDGGIVLYVTVQGPNSNGINNYGVRLFGSALLPFPNVGTDPTGITVVSDQAIYVQGDYNSGNPWQPAAIIADSINVLSNNWSASTNACRNDCQSDLSLSQATRNASNTTFNTAFLANVDREPPYNGGLQNYPRMHENWCSGTLTYRGSFVSLGFPRHVNGVWTQNDSCAATVSWNMYTPPARNWDYDSRFNDAINLPPLTPRAIYVQQTLFSQSFL